MECCYLLPRGVPYPISDYPCCIHCICRELGVSDIISAEAMSSPSIEEEAVCTYLSLFSVAMSASLVAWLRGLLGPSGPRGLSPEEWRNGDLLGKLIQVRTPDTAGTERDLSELFDLLRDRMGTLLLSAVDRGVTVLSRYNPPGIPPGPERG